MKKLNILIVGGGIAGMCAAIELRKRQHQVDLVELDPDWRVYGAGITLSGPTLRAMTEVGVIDDVLAEGWCADGADIFSAQGDKLGELPTPRVGRPDVPGGGGILRPVLARILREHTLAAGVAVRCGTTFVRIEEVKEHVEVDFADGRQGRYDLVIGADGLRSKVRQVIFPEAAKPAYTGQGVWRAVVPRPEAVARASMFMGPGIKAGLNPISQDEMYMFVTERRDTPDIIEEAAWAETLRGLLAPFGGLIGEIRDGLDDRSRILYRPFFALLLGQPWHRGRVVLIGDAVHATTAHLASGAGMGIEDAVVLAQELDRGAAVESALTAFSKRRYERCRMVVENSVKLGDIERSGGSKDEHSTLMRSSMTALLAPA